MTHNADKEAARNAIVGNSAALRLVVDRAVRIAATPFPVLVTGESGTGKELMARLLHDHSAVARGPLITVNCGALSRELAESELFGHERGAFTGAAGRRSGWFEEASGGTLVLDEIGELPLDLQPKLLRVLETGRLRRVGGGEVAVNVRVVAMTLRDLRADAQRGRFRLDLFHRLAGFEITLPALRDRPGDIPPLCRHFLADLERDVGARTVTAEALRALAAHDWPGNVRELRNVLRRAAVLSPTSVIDAELLELEPAPPATSWGSSRAADAPMPVRLVETPRPPKGVIALDGKSFVDIEKEAFAWALEVNGGSRRRAAATLGISRSTFCDRVKKLGVAPRVPTGERPAAGCPAVPAHW